MATQAEYTAVANALLNLMKAEESKLPPWQEAFIPQKMLPSAAGTAAKVAVDTLDSFRALNEDKVLARSLDDFKKTIGDTK